MRAVLSVSLPEPLAAERSRLATETGRSKSDIGKASVTPYLWEARFREMRRCLFPPRSGIFPPLCENPRSRIVQVPRSPSGPHLDYPLSSTPRLTPCSMYF
jgi:hypothetical protein